MRPLQLPPKLNYRAFLLGIADEKTEIGVEEAVLAGKIDSTYIQFLEEELIDDHLFERLSPEEEQSFMGHFLCTDDRRRRLATAQAIKRYASQQLADFVQVRENLQPQEFNQSHFFWRTATFATLAASCILAFLLFVQFQHTHQEAEVASKGATEVERLNAALAAINQRPVGSTPTNTPAHATQPQTNLSHSAENTPDLVLTSGQTRGPALLKGSGAQRDLQYSASKRFALVELILPPLSGDWYREELINSDEETLLAQEMPIHGVQAESHSVMALPMAMLPPGDYQIHLLVASSDKQFRELYSYSFRVKRP